MKKILAIGASNSKKSINKTLATYIANQIQESEINVLDWEEMVLPLYSPDLEAESGIPDKVHQFKQFIQDADAIVLSLAEHNGLPTAAFKNLWDWASRIEQSIWADKPMLLAATSPGARGGANVLQVIKNAMPFFGGQVVTDFSLPSFYDNFQDGKIVNSLKLEELKEKINLFKESI